MALLLQVLLSGLAAGGVYGLIGLGFTLVWRLSGVFNFAHGELLSVAIFAFLLVLGGGGAVGVVGFAAPLLAGAALVALAAGAITAVGLQVAAVRPYLNRVGPIGWIAATAAAGILLRSLIQLRFPAESYSAPDLLGLAGLGGGDVIDLGGGVTFPIRALGVLALSLALGVGLTRWLAVSRTGRAMAAASQDAEGARLAGVSVERLQLVAFAIAGLLAAAAGLLLAPARPITLSLGILLGLKGITAAVMGRLGSPAGAILAGLGLGVVESAAGNYVNPAAQDLLAPALLVLLLAAFPARLAGGAEAVE